MAARTQWDEEILAARQLGYPSEVIQKLKKEPNETKRNMILHDAREGKYDEE